jgi:hypothetical protein|tara:strand:- start:111 stop:344 length:234 start_codon:yes stop_codon:yes gene_type:complete
MIIKVETKYEVWGYTEVELPEGKTSDDIKEMYMKWGHGSIVFKDGTTLEEYFYEEEGDDHEYYKRPKELYFEEIEEE